MKADRLSRTALGWKSLALLPGRSIEEINSLQGFIFPIEFSIEFANTAIAYRR